MEPGTALPELLTAAEVAEALRVSAPTVSRYAKDGVLTPIRIGKSLRFRRDDIERLLRGEQAS